MPTELIIEALIAGVLLGCFYAAVSLGLSVAFGLLLGLAIYRFYHYVFEADGGEGGLRGLAFFFGVAFVVEVALILTFGVDQRMAQADYIGTGISFGEMRMPVRMVIAFAVALVLTIGLTQFLSRTFIGRAIRAVAQDRTALALMGADPVRIKQWAFGIATASCAIAGALLLIVSPVEPGLGRLYIGRTFCVVVLAGLGSIHGTLVAGIILGVAESLVLTSLGASWAPAVGFGLLLLVLTLRPSGLFGR
jgi:branched-chain amino acid transport system permease protein